MMRSVEAMTGTQKKDPYFSPGGETKCVSGNEVREGF